MSTDYGGRAPVLRAKAKSAHPSNTIVARAGGEGSQEFFPGLSRSEWLGPARDRGSPRRDTDLQIQTMADGQFDVYLIKAKPAGRQSTVEDAALQTRLSLRELSE